MFWNDKAKNQIGDKEALLQDITGLTGCMYLSDIKNSRYGLSVVRALKQIPPENYSRDAWKELIIYLTGKEEKVTDQGEAKQYLIEYLYKNI